MIGRRVQPDENGYAGKLEPGDYICVAPLRRGDGQPFTEEEKAEWWTQPYWMACSPNGHVGNLQQHEVTEHEDGTISVKPSILIKARAPDCTAVEFKDIKWVELYHGHLERGVWRSV